MSARALVALLWTVLPLHFAIGAEDHSQHQEEPPPHDAGHHSSSTVEQDEHAQHRPASSNEPGESEREHVPPDPPEHSMGDMPPERMIELMQMEDNAAYWKVLLDQFEWREVNDASAQAWEFDAWYGDDYNKLWLETEGERVEGDADGRVELMWDRIIAPWWSFQTGVRHDFAEGPSRTWLDLGIQGLAPYFFEVDAALYIGEEGRSAARLSGEYDILITQRLILQPEVELRAFGKDDPENGIGSGLSNMEFGVRLRYEIRREFAPYVGVHWERKFGNTADLARAAGEDADQWSLVAGLRVWF
jgi:copper resistance protein B